MYKRHGSVYMNQKYILNSNRIFLSTNNRTILQDEGRNIKTPTSLFSLYTIRIVPNRKPTSGDCFVFRECLFV